MSKEINAGIDITWALLRINCNTGKTKLSVKGESFEIESLTKGRVAVFFLTQCVRLALDLTLLWFG